MRKQLMSAAAVAVLAMCGSSASAAELWNNGGVVTNPTGGTGTIAGQPISQIELPGINYGFSIDESGETFSPARIADNFTVSGPGWNLDSVRVFAYQTGATSPTLTSVRLELFNGSPAAGGTSLGSVSVAAGAGSLVAYRQTNTGTSDTTRRIFSYDVSIDGLAAANNLAPGTYWLAVSGVGSLASGPWAPPVAPRAGAPDLNAVQATTTAGVTTYATIDDGGSPVALPFVLNGTLVPEPASLSVLALGGLAMLRRRR